MSASRGRSDYAATIRRRHRLWRLLAARAGDDSWPGWASSLCALAVEALETVCGAAITVRTGTRPALLAASDLLTCEMERLGAVLEEGPPYAALLSGVPVHVADISKDDTLWPAYAVAARDAGLVGISAFPLLFGGDAMGTFTVYRRQRERAPDHLEWIDTAIAADLAVSALLADEAHGERLLRTGDPARDVAVAAGIVGARFDISFDEAVSRLRHRASRTKLPIRDVATNVICHRIG